MPRGVDGAVLLFHAPNKLLADNTGSLVTSLVTRLLLVGCGYTDATTLSTIVLYSFLYYSLNILV